MFSNGGKEEEKREEGMVRRREGENPSLSFTISLQIPILITLFFLFRIHVNYLLLRKCRKELDLFF